jgi:hypothetical protein
MQRALLLRAVSIRSAWMVIPTRRFAVTLPPDIRITSEVLWRGALIFALIDAGFVPLLAWRIKPARFRQLKWILVGTMAVFFSAIWGALASYYFWEPVYHYIFPEWARWLLPPVYGLLFAAVGLLFWWLALRLPGNAVVNFCLLGGLWGMISHVVAVHGGIVDKPPMLQGASPVAAIVIAIFEFIFYWCISVSAAWLLRRGWELMKSVSGLTITGGSR